MPQLWRLNHLGQPVPEPDPLVWVAWWERMANGMLRATEIDGRDGPVRVRTRFHGIDDDDGCLFLWGSLVVGGRLDGVGVRYSTEKDALAGHERLVARVRREEEASQCHGR